MNYSRGLHHFHKRKRIYEKHEPYPHPDRSKRIMDKLIYLAGIVGPLLVVPQLYKIWIEKNAAGVSVISWSAFVATAVFWLIYGIMHKAKPIIFTYTIWIILELFVVVGTIIYG